MENETGAGFALSKNIEILKSEIKVYQNLVNERVTQIDSLEKTDFETILDKITHAFHESRRQEILRSKIDRLTTILEKLTEFCLSEECVVDDVVQEYINYLETKSDNFLLIKPRFVRWLLTAPLDQVIGFMDSKDVKSFATVLFVIMEENRYSLILFSKHNTSFYHYDLTKKNYHAAEQLMFRLRSYLGITRMVQVECIVKGVQSSVFLMENILKIMKNYEKIEEGDSFVMKMLNVPPQSDRLVLIMAKKYVDRKFEQIVKIGEIE